MELRLREMLWCLFLVKPLSRSLCVVIENQLFITRHDLFEKCIVFMPQQQSWTELVTSFFLPPPVNSYRNHLSIFLFFPISEKLIWFFQHFVQAHGGFASTTSLRVSSSRDHFLPVYITSSSLSLPCRNLWNHFCAVRTGTDPSPNASLMFLAVSEAVFPSFYLKRNIARNLFLCMLF